MIAFGDLRDEVVFYLVRTSALRYGVEILFVVIYLSLESCRREHDRSGVIRGV